MKVVFFGTPHYSLLVLEPLYKAGYEIACVVTKPPLPMGRKRILTPTPVALWAGQNKIPVSTPTANKDKSWLYANEKEVTRQVSSFQPDILITADYAQKIPPDLIKQVQLGGINVHPSLLPQYRGPAPVPWAILSGETETGVSLVTLAEKFDEGEVIAQEKEPISPIDTTDSLMTKLFTQGGELLLRVLPTYTLSSTRRTRPLPLLRKEEESAYLKEQKIESYFPRMNRDTGFVPWELVKAAMEGKTSNHLALRQFSHVTIIQAALNKSMTNRFPLALVINCAYRALHPWPGLWTRVKLNDQNKRLKILKLHLGAKSLTLNASLVLDEIQVEGKSPLLGPAAISLVEKIEEKGKMTEFKP